MNLSLSKLDLVTTMHCPFSIEPMEGKDALHTQDRGCDLLQICDINHWISSGNLLGLYRDNQLIPHDTDIDINFSLEWNTEETYNKLVELINQFQTHGFNLVYSTFVLNHAMQLAWMDLDTNVICDLYGFYTGIERGKAVNYNPEGIIRKPVKFTKNLGVLKNYPIPGKIEEFLVWRFGKDWRTPKTHKVPWQEEANHLEKWL